MDTILYKSFPCFLNYRKVPAAIENTMANMTETEIGKPRLPQPPARKARKLAGTSNNRYSGGTFLRASTAVIIRCQYSARNGGCKRLSRTYDRSARARSRTAVIISSW